jgi:hypothetical protein
MSFVAAAAPDNRLVLPFLKISSPSKAVDKDAE